MTPAPPPNQPRRFQFRGRCPRCLGTGSKRKATIEATPITARDIAYRCTHCGHTWGSAGQQTLETVCEQPAS